MLGLAWFTREDTGFLFLVSALAVYAVFQIVKNNNASVFLILALFVVSRLIFLFFDPHLSDDVFRFHWDALVQQEGFSAYEYLPSELQTVIDSNNSLYQKLNSKDYYSVYPPVLQYLFVTVNKLFPHHFYLGLKGFIILFELALYAIIYALNKELKIFKNAHLFLWILFPVLVLEGLGNFHLEILMIPFFILAYLMHQSSKWHVSVILMAIAISNKITIAPMLLLFVGKGLREDFKFLSLLFILLAVLNIELIGQWSHFSESLNLYFSSFEFNNLVYFGIREIWQSSVGYNPIQQYGLIFKCLLVVVALSFYLLLVIKKKNAAVLLHVFFAIYFLFNPVIHPWYLLVPFSLNLVYRVRIWELWSVIALLSYAFYANMEQLGWWIYLEYGLLFLACLYMMISKNKSQFRGIMPGFEKE